MHKIEINVITGERKVIEFTAEEIAEHERLRQEFEKNKITKEEQIAKLQEQIEALKGVA